MSIFDSIKNLTPASGATIGSALGIFAPGGTSVGATLGALAGKVISGLNNNNSGNGADLTGKKSDTTDTNNDATDSNTELATMIQNLYDTQKRSNAAALKSAFETSTGNLKNTYNSNIAGLNTTQNGIADTYYAKRNQAAAQSDVGAMNFAQYMAARGIKGNAGGMPEIYRNAALQANLNNLNTAEAGENADIDIQKQLLTNNYNNDLTTAQNAYLSNAAASDADVDAQRIQAQITQAKDDAATKLAQDTQARQEFIANIGQYSDNYQLQIDKVTNDGDPTNDWQIPYLKSARNEKIAAQNAADAAASQQDFENWYKQQQLGIEAEKAAKSGSSGSSSGSHYTSGGLSYPQLLDTVQGMYNSGRSDKERYDFIVNNGGQYRDALLTAAGLSGYGQQATTNNYNGIKSQVQSMIEKIGFGGSGASIYNDIGNYLTDKINRGEITQQQAYEIATEAGMPWNG